MDFPAIDADLAARFSGLALGHVEREYPNKLDHVLTGPEDARTPSALHPIFFGSFDWHSCVHGYWLLARLLRLQPGHANAEAIRALFDAPVHGGEGRRGAGLSAAPIEPRVRAALRLGLAAQAAGRARAARDAGGPGLGDRHGAAGRGLRRPVQGLSADRRPIPLRAGVHSNTAFALALAIGLCGNLRRRRAWPPCARPPPAAGTATTATARPGSRRATSSCRSALMEAECMRRSLPPADFAEWFDAFLPRARAALAGEPVHARHGQRPQRRQDRPPGRAESRPAPGAGGCSPPVPDRDRSLVCAAAAKEHLAASLPHVAGDYMGEHWLASFALLALTD